MTKPRICITTGTRADYGLLYWLMRDLLAHSAFDLQVIAAAMHLSPDFGETVAFIRRDGFAVDEQVPCLDADDSPVGMGRAYVRATDGFLGALTRLKPDLLIILGDRFEALAAATAATLLHIPIAHIHGGEITAGAIDDTFRHAITKMAHLHFTAADEYSGRVVQMGEPPSHVHNVGAVGLDNFVRLSLPTRQALAADIGFDLSNDYAVMTYHPATMESGPPLAGLEIVLQALSATPGLRLLITKANSDPGGRLINQRLESFREEQSGRVHLAASLGQARYLAAIKYAAVVVGNSSSGIIEAPAVGVPTVNIGSRQQGRLRAQSIIDVGLDSDAITDGIRIALQPAYKGRSDQIEPPYGSPGDAAGKIISILFKTPFDKLMPKSFYDLPTMRYLSKIL